MKTNFCSILPLLLLLVLLTACQQDTAPDSAPPTEEEQAAFQARMLETYAPAMEHFALTQSGNTLFFNHAQLEETFSIYERMGLTDHLNLQSGDTTPLFLWDEASQIMQVLVLDRNGEFLRYTFHKADAPAPEGPDWKPYWELTETPQIWPPSDTL